MNRYQKLFSNTVILAIGTFGSKLLVFLLMPLYTAYLSTAEYSTAELITTTANLLIPLACLGISQGMFRFTADRESNKREVFSSGIALLSLGLGGFLILSPLFFFIEYFRTYVWLIVLYVFFADIQAVCAQFVYATDRAKLFAVQGILNTAFTIAFNLLFLVGLRMNVVGYVLSVILGNLCTTLFMVIKAKLWREFSISYVNKSLMKELLKFSLPMVPTTICWLITDLSDRYMVTYFCGDAINGIYSAAYKIPTIVNLVCGVFLQAWQFSAVSEESEGESYRKFYSGVFSGYLSVVFIGASGLVLLSGFLTGLLLNRAYAGAAHYMPTLLCAMAFEAIVSFLASIYLVRKRSINSFCTAVLGSILNIVLNLWWIPLYGALGAAIATACSYALVLLLRMIDTRRYLAFHLSLPRLGINTALLLASVAAMTAEISGAFWWTFAITAVVALINLPYLYKSVCQLLAKRVKN